MQEIFVFGSNMQGIHGAGSAKEALRNHGAIWGQGTGLQGQAYAIPTRTVTATGIKTLELWVIKVYVKTFIEFAVQHPELQFRLVEIGCGYAGYMPEDIAPLFQGAPENCLLPESFKRVLGK